MRRLAIAAAIAASAIATAVLAGQQDFVIVNNTGQTILTLNVSPASEDSWGPDILGTDVLAAGQRGEVSFDNDEERCDWDIRVTYADGDTGDWRGIDLCETAVVELS
ncbi:MAG TPA: hypothetical protein VEW25_08070 [Allosphingosinicella sp.]|nr:hypothetical protein [Allosphingosinicella sp.]